MKSLLSTFIFGFLLLTAFSSCQKELKTSSILYDGHLFIGQDIDFSSASTSPFSYSWNFGDGTTAEGGYHTHSYSAPGVYTVQLIVTSEGGSHTSTITVNIKSYPRKVRITATKLLNIDFQRNWDSSSSTGPDVYFKFSKLHTGTLLSANSSIIQNVTASQLPLRWTASTPVLELDYDVAASIGFYDDDNGTSELMQGASILFEEEIPFESNIISLPKFSLLHTGPPTIELEVEYIY